MTTVACLLGGGDIPTCCPTGAVDENDGVCTLLACVELDEIAIKDTCQCMDIIAACEDISLVTLFAQVVPQLPGMCSSVSACCADETVVNTDWNTCMSEKAEAGEEGGGFDTPDFGALIPGLVPEAEGDVTTTVEPEEPPVEGGETEKPEAEEPPVDGEEPEAEEPPVEEEETEIPNPNEAEVEEPPMVGTSYCTYAPDETCYESGWPACCGDETSPCPEDGAGEQPPCEIATTTEAPTTEAPPAEEVTTTEAPPTEEVTTTEAPPTEEVTTTEAPPTEEATTTESPPATTTEAANGSFSNRHVRVGAAVTLALIIGAM